MYSTKDTALEALKHCIHLDDPFNDVSCNEGCPLWKQCTGYDIDVIFSDLKEILAPLGARDLIDRLMQVYAKYFDDDFDEEQIPVVLKEVYAFLRSAGCYKG